MKKIRAILLYLLFSFAFMPLIAQHDDGRMLTLSLDDLAKIQVKTASGNLETVSNAPGIISVMTESEIRLCGANNIAEILDKMPGVSLYSTYFSIQTSLGIRGDIPTNTNNHTLFLIDGRPFRESLSGGTFNRTFLTAFPVSAIERVELLRGSGSVLYGNNAYTGVVNVITKKAVAKKGEISLESGSLTSVRGEVFGQISGETFNVSSALSGAISKGWQYTATDGYGTYNSQRMPSSNIGAFFGVQKNEFNATLFVASANQRLMEISNFQWSNPPTFTYAEKRVMADIGYAPVFSEKVSFEAHCTANFAFLRPFFDVDSAKDLSSSSDLGNYTMEAEAIFTPSQIFTLKAGAALELRSGEIFHHTYFDNAPDTVYPILPFNVFRGINPKPYPIVPAFNENSLNGYALSTLSLTNTLKASGGLQYFRTQNIDDIVYRFAGVYSGETGISAKLLYSRGYRAPSASETKTWVPGIITGSDSLQSEYIATLEAQCAYSTENLFLAATVFRSTQTNLITLTLPGEKIRTSVGGKPTIIGAPFYINRGDAATNGLELEAKTKIGSTFSAQSSFSYYGLEQKFRTLAGDTTLTNYTGMPHIFLKIGLSYFLSNLAEISLFDVFYGGMDDISPKSSPNGVAKDFHDVNISGRIFLSAFTDNAFLGNCSLLVKIDNVFNAEIYYPEYSERSVNAVPGRSGRTFSAQLRCTF